MTDIAHDRIEKFGNDRHLTVIFVSIRALKNDGHCTSLEFTDVRLKRKKNRTATWGVLTYTYC